MTIKSSISLTDEQHAFAKDLVDTGRYPSVSAVLQQGIDLLRSELDRRDAEAAALRELLGRRRAGKAVSAASMKSKIEAMVARKRRSHALDD